MDEEELKGLLARPEAVEEARVEETPAEAAGETPAVQVTPAEADPRVKPEDEGPVRDEKGRFVASVPLSAMLDEREKRQALERRLADIEAAKPPPEPPTRDQQLEAALYGQNLRASRRFAEREYGKDTIATVHDWAAARCDSDPAFNAQMRSSEDPYESAYQAYSREQVLAEVKPGELDAYRAWKQAQAQAAAAPQPAPDAPLPRSLATASGTGAAGVPHVNVGPGQAFASAIPR